MNVKTQLSLQFGVSSRFLNALRGLDLAFVLNEMSEPDLATLKRSIQPWLLREPVALDHPVFALGGHGGVILCAVRVLQKLSATQIAMGKLVLAWHASASPVELKFVKTWADSFLSLHRLFKKAMSELKFESGAGAEQTLASVMSVSADESAPSTPPDDIVLRRLQPYARLDGSTCIQTRK